MKSETEVWKSLPGVPGIEVSTFGRVRTLDKVVSSEKRTRFIKGRILKQSYNRGYLNVNIPIDGKWCKKIAHRLIAQTFIPNPDNLPDVNHKNCIRDDNHVENLEWCTSKYNIQYREEFGKALNHPIFAINLNTLEVSHFKSQRDASRELGVSQGNLNSVVKGNKNHAGGFWFKEDDGNGIEIDKDKLNDIAAGMRFTGGVFAVNLNTLEVSRFKSQREASRVLGVDNRYINAVIKGRYKQSHGFWFTKDDDNADDIIKRKLKEV